MSPALLPRQDGRQEVAGCDVAEVQADRAEADAVAAVEPEAEVGAAVVVPAEVVVAGVAPAEVEAAAAIGSMRHCDPMYVYSSLPITIRVRQMSITACNVS